MNESYFGPPPFSDPSAAMRKPIGNTNGRYRFFKVRRYGKLHFEKRIAESHLNDIVTAEALRKEFEIGYGLEHPAIVRYLAYEDNAILEEYIDGQTLRQMLSSNDDRLANPEFLQNLCFQLLQALDHIHRHGIIHLDIKPENVMVCSIGNAVKLIDFGSARTAEFDSTEGFTPGYMAPEQAGQDQTGVATDIYLLGRLMEELTLNRPTAKLWADFIATATNPDPSQRFGSAIQALNAMPNLSLAPPKTQSRPKKQSKPNFLITLIKAIFWWFVITVSLTFIITEIADAIA